MARSASGSRHIDLAIRVVVADVEQDATGRPRWRPGTDVELVTIGGRWDRRRKRWAQGSGAQRCLVLRFHRGQEDAARWFVDWLRRFVRNDWRGVRRAYSMLLIGGRRSGKTHVACAALVLFAVLSPRALIWALSPTLETGDELDENLRSLLPRGWYVRKQAKTGRSTTYRLANGSRILLKSAVKPQRLKAGRVDLVLLNESQELQQLAYVKVRAAIADRGGLVIMTANPPDSPMGRWVEEHYVAARGGAIESVVFELDPRNNPWINYEALASIGSEIDQKTYERDVLGLFPPIGDVVMHAWSDRDSIRDVPLGWIEVTAEVTKAKLGRAAGYVVGMDFQRTPHMAAVVFKLFADPAEPGEAVPFVVDEAVVEDADEDDLLDALEAMPRWRTDGERDPEDTYRGWIEKGDSAEHPVHCAVVMDASAWWQDGEHSKTRNSDRRLAARRWSFLYRPRPEVDKDGQLLRNNPPISERVKVTNARLKSATIPATDERPAVEGRRRMFVTRHCTWVRKAMRNWENSKITGQPNRHSAYAHVCDAVSYPIYRLFAAPFVKRAKQEYRSKKFSRPSEMRAW